MKNKVPQLIPAIIFVVITGVLFIGMTFVPMIYFVIRKSPDIGGLMAIVIGVVIFLPLFIASIIFLIKTIEKSR